MYSELCALIKLSALHPAHEVGKLLYIDLYKRGQIYENHLQVLVVGQGLQVWFHRRAGLVYGGFWFVF